MPPGREPNEATGSERQAGNRLARLRSSIEGLASNFRRMKRRRFELVPEVAPTVTVHVDDDRHSLGPDEDLIEIGISMQEQAIAVTLSLEEITRLRDALTAVIDQPLP
jgi:hypothetical protein